MGLIGVIWLTQALQTAHRLSAVHTVLATLLVAALSAALLFGLYTLVGGQITKFVNMIASPFLPWPG